MVRGAVGENKIEKTKTSEEHLVYNSDKINRCCFLAINNRYNL